MMLRLPRRFLRRRTLSVLACTGILLLSACASSRRAALPLPPIREIFGSMQTTSLFLAQVGGGNESQDLGVLNGNALVRINTHTLFTATDGTGVSSSVADTVLSTVTGASVLVYEYTGQEQELLRQGKTGADAFTGKWYLSPALLAQRPQLNGLPVLTAFNAGKTYDVRSDIPLVLTAIYSASASPAFRAQIAPIYRCGNGRTEPQQFISELGLSHLTEGCDDGNDVDTDTCSNQCQVRTPDVGASCGNGVKEGTEQCDHRNDRSRGCTAECRATVGYMCQADNTCVRLIPDFGGSSKSWVIVLTYEKNPLSDDAVRTICQHIAPSVSGFFEKQASFYGKKKPFDSVTCIQQQLLLPQELIDDKIPFTCEGQTFPSLNSQKVSAYLEKNIPALQQAAVVTVVDFMAEPRQFCHFAADQKHHFIFIGPIEENAYYPPIDLDSIGETMAHELMHNIGASDKYAAIDRTARTCCAIDPITRESVEGSDIMCHLVYTSEMDGACMSVPFADLNVGPWSAQEIGWLIREKKADVARLVVNQLPLPSDAPLVRGKDDQIVFRFQMASPETLSVGTLFFQQEAETKPEIVDVWPIQSLKLECGTTAFQPLQVQFRSDWATLSISEFRLPDNSPYFLPANTPVTCNVRAKIKDYTQTKTFKFRFAHKEYGLDRNYVAANNPTGTILENIRTNGVCASASCDIAVTLLEPPALRIADSAASSAASSIGPSSSAAPISGPWSTNGNVWAMKQLGNTLFLGGSFTEVGGQPRYGLAAVDATTGEVLPWNPNANYAGVAGEAIVQAMALEGNTLYVGGSFSYVGPTVRNRIAAIDATSGVVLPWGAALNAKVDNTPSIISSLALVGDTLYGGGNNYRCGLAAWNKTTGELVTAWHPCVNHYVTALAPVPGGNLLVAGMFDMVTNSAGTSQARTNVAIVNGSTGEFLPWAPKVNGTVYAAFVNGTNVFLGGNFAQVEGKPRQNFAVLNATSGALSDIKADANAPVWVFLLDGFKLYVGGGFSFIGGQATDTGLAVMDPYVGGVLPWNRLTTQSLPRQPKALASDGQYLYAGGGLIDIFGRPFLNPLGKVRK